MPAWLLALLPKALDLVLLLFGGGKKDAALDKAEELGATKQQNATMKEDMTTVRRATEAARKAEQEPFDDDPNDRDRRR